jgi:cyclase
MNQAQGENQHMHSTLIVARMDDASRTSVANLFADFDATEMPHIMGTRDRQLFAFRGLYFHVQSFDTDNGVAQIEKAKTDPRFVRISNELKPFIEAYDPATWRSPADATATRFYHWTASA